MLHSAQEPRKSKYDQLGIYATQHYLAIHHGLMGTSAWASLHPFIPFSTAHSSLHSLYLLCCHISSLPCFLSPLYSSLPSHGLIFSLNSNYCTLPELCFHLKSIQVPSPSCLKIAPHFPAEDGPFPLGSLFLLICLSSGLTLSAVREMMERQSPHPMGPRHSLTHSQEFIQLSITMH